MSEFHVCPECGNHPAMPQGKPNKEVQRFMAEYPEIPRFMFICPAHGKWFSVMDEYAPYLWDLCRCADCEHDYEH